MTDMRLPYQLKEGQIAYARRVMANFNAIINALNNLRAEGITAEGLEELFTELASTTVKKNQAGNADEIVFADGATMQQKLDAGAFNGRDAVLYEGFAAFNIGDDGYLYVTTTTGNNPYSIDEDGYLILNIPDAPAEDVQSFKLGKVVGGEGPAGPVGPTGVSGNYSATVYAASSSGDNSAAWDNRSAESTYKTATVSCAGITASNNFIVQPAKSATDEQWAAWATAAPIVKSQANGSFVLYARNSNLPTVDIPLEIVVNI